MGAMAWRPPHLGWSQAFHLWPGTVACAGPHPGAQVNANLSTPTQDMGFQGSLCILEHLSPFLEMPTQQWAPSTLSL